MKILERIVQKLTSARFLLTLIVGITFSIYALQGNLSSTEVITVFTSVTAFYFTKDRESTSTNKDEEK